MVKHDPKKNMTEFLLNFEINMVWKRPCLKYYGSLACLYSHFSLDSHRLLSTFLTIFLGGSNLIYMYCCLTEIIMIISEYIITKAPMYTYGRTFLLFYSEELALIFSFVHFWQLSIQLCRLSAGLEVPVLRLEIEGLGTELKVRTFDMTSYTFLREICLECSEYTGVSSQVHSLARTRTHADCHDDLFQVVAFVTWNSAFVFLFLKMEKTKRFTSSPLWITQRMIYSHWSMLR